MRAICEDRRADTLCTEEVVSNKGVQSTAHSFAASDARRSPGEQPLAAKGQAGILPFMSAVEESEAAIQQLSPDGMAAFRAWCAEFDAASWDRQIAANDAAGRLDWLVQEALDDLDAGRCTDR